MQVGGQHFVSCGRGRAFAVRELVHAFVIGSSAESKTALTAQSEKILHTVCKYTCRGYLRCWERWR